MNFEVNGNMQNKIANTTPEFVPNNTTQNNNDITLDFSSDKKNFIYNNLGSMEDLSERVEELKALFQAQETAEDEEINSDETQNLAPTPEEVDKYINPSLREVTESTKITQENLEEMKELLNWDDDRMEQWINEYNLDFVTLEDGSKALRISNKETGKPIADYNYPGEPYESRTLYTYSYDDEGNCRIDKYQQAYMRDGKGRAQGWAEQLVIWSPFYYTEDGERLPASNANEDNFKQNPIHKFARHAFD